VTALLLVCNKSSKNTKVAIWGWASHIELVMVGGAGHRQVMPMVILIFIVILIVMT